MTKYVITTKDCSRPVYFLGVFLGMGTLYQFTELLKVARKYDTPEAANAALIKLPMASTLAVTEIVEE